MRVRKGWWSNRLDCRRWCANHWMENRVMGTLGGGEMGVWWGQTGRQNGRSQRWSCSQSGQDLRAQGGHPSSAPIPTPTLAFQAFIFHMISLPPVLRLALALQTVRVTAPFSVGKTFTETCFITVDLMVSKMMHAFLFWYLCFMLKKKSKLWNVKLGG